MYLSSKKLKISFFCLFFVVFSYAHSGEDYMNLLMGYQLGYTNQNNRPILQGFDINYTLLFANIGANYQVGVGSKLFIGAGFFELLQLQCGYSLKKDEFLLRFRSDSRTFWHEIFGDEYNTVGFFFENRFNRHGYQGFNVGVSIGISFFYIKDKIFTK